MNLRIDTRVVDGITIMSCHGRVMFGEEATALRDSLKEALTKTTRLVLNLSEVSYIDSGGLGTLVGFIRPRARLGPTSSLPAWDSACGTCCRLPSWRPSFRFLIPSRRRSPR